MEALRAEEDRLKPIIENCDYKNYIFRQRSYKTRSLYKEQLARYFEYFPRKHILVLSSESFFTEPLQTLNKVFNFIGIAPDFSPQDLKPRNVASNRTIIDNEVYDYLDAYFRVPNQELFELLGETFDWNQNT